MILVNSAQGAEATRRRFVTGDGLESSVVRYFGFTASAAPKDPPAVGVLYPVAFRVEQDPGTTSEPHFHQANQFQVFVDGDGFLGKTPARPVTIQYAGAYTPYGPIVAGTNGIAYLTLRNGFDPGALYMPGARDRLRAFGRKPRSIVRATDIAAQAPACETIVERGDDGLGAWRYRLGPNETFTGPHPGDGGGQYWVCVNGTDLNSASPMERLSCAFLTPDEPARAAVAGPDGLDVLVLQFPRFAAA
jgi:hypothetical protein